MDLTDTSAAPATDTTAASAADFTGVGTPAPTSAAEPGTTPEADPGNVPSSTVSNDLLALFSGEAAGDSPSARDWVNAKGFKSLDDLVAGYREAERTIRDKGIVRPPSEGASETQLAEWREAIGVPKTAADYATPEIKGADGQLVELNTGLIDSLKAVAHKAGVPREGFEALITEAITAQQIELSTVTADLEKRASAFIEANWKGDRDGKLEQVDAGLAWLGLNKQEAEALRMAIGPEKALTIAQKVGENLKEDTLVRGSVKAKFGMSGEAAQAKLDAIKADPVRAAKAMVPGSAERMEYERMVEIVAADQQRKLEEMG